MTAPDAKRAFTTAEAANYIGLSVSQLRALVRGRHIAARRTGEKHGLLLFLKESLDEYLEGLPEA